MIKTINDNMTLREFETYVGKFFHSVFSIHEPITEAKFHEWIEILKSKVKD